MTAFTFVATRDTNDGEPWSEMAIEDLINELRHGGTVETAAALLCRQGTIDEVRRKAKELGLIPNTQE